MSRWNPCCCGGAPVILPDDMVLVRAGWYHFMVLTRDGRIQVFIGSGTKITQNDTLFLSQGIISKIAVGPDGINVINSPLWFIDELGIHSLSQQAKYNLDPDAWKLVHGGTHAFDGFFYDWGEGEIADDYRVTPPVKQGGIDPFGMITLYPEACQGWGGTTGTVAPPVPGVCGGEALPEGYYNPPQFPSTPNPAVSVGGCPHYKIIGNIDASYYLYPDRPMEFDGSGISIGRPPGTVRHAALIEARGLSLISGISLQTLYESYDLVAKPAPVNHPLAIPTELKSRLDSGERRVIDIECGAYHNIVRLDDNTIMCWGLNAFGQCNVPDVLRPSWEIPNGEIISASIDLEGISLSERLVRTENPEVRIFETGDPPLTGSGASVRLTTDLSDEPDGPRIFEVTGIEILDPGIGYRKESINWALPSNELNASVLAAGITFDVAPITNLSNIKDTICSIHAGFNTSAVLFHGGTALCWGDPDVADEVNSWEHIRVSPIKKSQNEQTHCNGTNSEGFIDPEYPEFPENKYKKGTYNANIDWWGLWKDGTPAYPHFDLGVETNKIYPLQWDSSQPSSDLNEINAVPYGICNQCNTYWNNSGQDKIKDFAVAMLRTGQIVTTRKDNARDPNAPLCRDCSYDEKYEVSSGSMGIDWIGPNLSPYQGPLVDWDPTQIIDCLAPHPDGLITVCSKPGEEKICDEYKTWFIRAEDVQCGENDPSGGDYPEGIGCYSSLGNKEVLLYDQNWAYNTSFYSPAKQVRPDTHPNGPVPYWNDSQRIDATYGWETLVAAVDRDHRASDPAYRDQLPEQCLTKTDYMPSKCVMNISNAPCSDLCPSTARFIGEFRRRGNVEQYGVPGVFRYPAQIANTLMCSAGTNAVNWMHYPRLLSAQAFEDPNLGSEEDSVKPASIVINNCEKFHLGKGPNPCSECADYTNAPNIHEEEIADTTTSCIYAKETSEDALNNTNPLREGEVLPCQGRQIGENETFMLPTRAWGPWQLFTSSGTASPLETELSLCAKGILSYSFCAYMKITRKANGANMPPLDPEFGGGGSVATDGIFDMVPAWFTNYYIGPNSAFNLGSPVDAVNIDDELTRRPIRRDGGIRPVSSAWKVNFPAPFQLAGCYYPDICFDFDENGNRITPPEGDPISGRCPRGVPDTTTPAEPLAYVDCSLGQYGPCGGGILGGQVVNLNRYCFSDPSIGSELFPSEPMCLDNTSNVCGVNGCDQGIGNACNKWFLNNPAISYATGRGFSVFIRRSPWYRPETSIISDIAAGGEHSVALKSDGEFFGWGRNLEGQTTKTAVRMKILEAGENHNILITKGAEQVLCFGDNTYGQCDVPSGLAGSTAVSAGTFHSMALKKNFTTNNNEVFCWGCVKEISEVDATSYLLGDINDDVDAVIMEGNDPLYPGIVVTGISGPGGIPGRKADLYFDHLPVEIPRTGKYDMKFRVRNFGGVTATVAIEDYDKWIEFKNSRMATFQIPLTGVEKIYGITQNWITVDVKDIQMVRPSQRFVIRDITSINGGATGWDFNWFRVLPQEPNNKGQCDVPVTGVTSPSAISAGKYHSAAIIDPGSSVVSNVICWGDNSLGQCDVPEGLTGVVDIKAGDFYTIALTERETVKCWGNINCSDIEGLTGIVSISAGAQHGMVLKLLDNNEKQIIPFGSSNYGLGEVPSGITLDPSGLTGIYIEKISAGGYHNLVLRSDNVVKAWGRNNYGQILIPDDISTTGLVGGEFIWEPTCPTSLEQSFPNINFNGNKGWNREFVGTRGTKIWITGNVLDPCPPWPLNNGITAYYPEWVPRASGAGDRVAKKGVWINGSWTPTGGTGPDSYEKSIDISGFTLIAPNGHPLASTFPATSTIPLYEKVLNYFSP